jgi:hypothetical protein
VAVATRSLKSIMRDSVSSGNGPELVELARVAPQMWPSTTIGHATSSPNRRLGESGVNPSTAPESSKSTRTGRPVSNTERHAGSLRSRCSMSG